MSKTEAQKLLNYLRTEVSGYELNLILLRQEVEKGGFPLAAIGTSEEELEEFRVSGCKVDSQELLEVLRRGGEEYDPALPDAIRNAVERGGLALTDIGTSEEELRALNAKARSQPGALELLHERRRKAEKYFSTPGTFETVLKKL
ncbi:hypothetical protein HYT01_00170 [Candidatus Giovannonibacteria bacterium]|nr:hypothetical protein [Candidatus Giovannonibacteria bacterium]